MVLAKVDPYDSAFPETPNDYLNTTPGTATFKVKDSNAGLSKKNPFTTKPIETKQSKYISSFDIQKKGSLPITTKINIKDKDKQVKKGEIDLLAQDSTVNPVATVKKVNKGMQNTLDSSVHIDLPKEEDQKYGKDFKIPDLPPQLQLNQH